MELWRNVTSSPWHAVRLATQAERDAVYGERIRAKVADEGLGRIVRAQLGKQYARLLDHETFFVEQLPGGDRSAYRFASPTLRSLLHGLADVTHGVLLVALAFGVALLRVWPLRWPQILAGFLLYNLVLFSAMHVNPRFLVQLVPFMALLGGASVAAATGTEAGASAFAPATGNRVFAGALLAALLLYLAFGSVVG